MARKIDPLNKKVYGSVSTMLTVADVKAAAAFYQQAFGFEKRAIMDGPDGKAIHAELTLRGTTLMLGPENPQMGARSAKTIGGSPCTLYLLTGCNWKCESVMQLSSTRCCSNLPNLRSLAIRVERPSFLGFPSSTRHRRS